MRSRPLLAAASLLATSLSACRTASTAAPVRVATPQLAERTDAWHAERLAKLTAPDGWLSLVALAWLEPGANRVGRAADAEVSYAGLPADHVGTLHLSEGHGVRFEPATGVAVEGIPESGALRTDAEGDPTVLRLGDIRFHVVVRGGRPAVRMKDASAPTRTEFGGIERFPVDGAWSVVAEYEPAGRGTRIGLDTVIGLPAEADVTGRARFERDGETVDAVLFASGDGGSLLRFSDATSGRETYTIGRYLYVEPSDDGETVVLDFNRAYNPPCAFTAFATCSLPPPENRLPFPVRAGERWETDAGTDR